MVEKQEHKELKSCASRIFGGLTERTVDGRVDVKTPRFCVEIETTGRTDRIQHAIEKLSSFNCGGGFLIVPPNALRKSEELIRSKDGIIAIPSDKFKKICQQK